MTPHPEAAVMRDQAQHFFLAVGLKQAEEKCARLKANGKAPSIEPRSDGVYVIRWSDRGLQMERGCWRDGRDARLQIPR